jgi:AcrR family transcriptional regulator
MPKNRHTIDRASKEASILDAAEVAFVDDGWDGATITAIAAAVGITPTTIYWYFPTKDDLLVAVVRRWAQATLDELAEIAPRVPSSATGHLIQAALEQLRPLIGTLHERRRHSTAVKAVHEEVHERLVRALLSSCGAPDAASAEGFVLLLETIMEHDRGNPALTAAHRHLAD